jgi:hypothetical protein
MKKLLIASAIMLFSAPTFADERTKIHWLTCTNTQTGESNKTLVYPLPEDINDWATERFKAPHTCTKK